VSGWRPCRVLACPSRPLAHRGGRWQGDKYFRQIILRKGWAARQWLGYARPRCWLHQKMERAQRVRCCHAESVSVMNQKKHVREAAKEWWCLSVKLVRGVGGGRVCAQCAVRGLTGELGFEPLLRAVQPPRAWWCGTRRGTPRRSCARSAQVRLVVANQLRFEPLGLCGAVVYHAVRGRCAKDHLARMVRVGCLSLLGLHDCWLVGGGGGGGGTGVRHGRRDDALFVGVHLGALTVHASLAVVVRGAPRSLCRSGSPWAQWPWLVLRRKAGGRRGEGGAPWRRQQVAGGVRLPRPLRGAPFGGDTKWRWREVASPYRRDAPPLNIILLDCSWHCHPAPSQVDWLRGWAG